MNKFLLLFLFALWMNKSTIHAGSFFHISTTPGDTSTNPCHQFKRLRTAEEYFRSANNRTKGCGLNNDSITITIAAKEYGLAVELDPKFWQARRNYARQLMRLKQYELAIEQLTVALLITSSKENPDLNVMRGEAWYEKAKYQNAIDDLILL